MITQADEATVDPVAVAAIAEALRAFAKALRANQLYLPNNPTRQRATEIAQSLFTQVWYHTDAVPLEVRETELRWQSHTVYRDAERGVDSLPFLLYRDGLREVQLLPGFELEELPLLLALLQRAKAASPDEDDLVTLLWVADLNSVRYRHVEAGGDGDSSIAPLATAGVATFTPAGPQLAVPCAESDAPGDGPPPGIVRLDDFDTTLHFLDPGELAYLREEVRREYESDGRQDVLSILLDVVETQPRAAAQLEVIEVLEGWLVELIAAADYELVAILLREAGVSAERSTSLDAAARDRLLQLPAQLSEPAAMSQLLQALDESVRPPAAATLDALFGQLRPTAMPTLFAWLAAAPSTPMRTAVERAATKLAADNVTDFVRLLEHDDMAVVQVALRLASRLKSPAAVPGLGKVLRSADAPVRLDVVAALGEIASAGALQTLERAIDDPHRDVRVAALRAIAANRYGNALPRLAQALRRRELQDADVGEKMALFEAYGLLCGDEGVGTLDAMLNGRRLLRYREAPELRACAARALGHVGTTAAMAALQRAANAKDALVRAAVQRAVRGST